MQPLGGTSLGGSIYTADQVIAQMLAPTGERWRFDRLDSGGYWLEDCTSFIQFDPSAPTITHDSGAAVKRSIQFTARGDWSPTWLKDRIRARYGLLMPDGSYLEWVLGTFVMELPASDRTPARSYRAVRGYDLTHVLANSRFLTGTGLARGTNGVSGVISLIAQGSFTAVPNVLIPDLGRVLAQPLAWGPGDSVLAAVNDVLGAMTYQSLAADEQGNLTSQPFPDYNMVVSSYFFDTTSGKSLVKSPIRGSIDMSQAINAVRVNVTDPRTGLVGWSVYAENTDPSSPVSIPNWYRRLLVVDDSKIFDVGAAGARALLELQRGAWIYEAMPVATPPWPVSQELDVYALAYQSADEGSVYTNVLEVGWTHVCKTGASTTHQWRRLVNAG